jgi:ATP-dependent protease HslVU (ClpYQ) peptidase subunit
MTTFAYSKADNIIAIDGRVTAGSRIVSDVDKKYIKKGKNVYFTIGGLADAMRLIDLVEAGLEEIGDDNVYECQLVLAAIPPVEIYVNEAGYIESVPIIEDLYTLGSGGDHALTALDLGRTPKQAVQHAMTRDICSGGKIIQYDLTKGKFK